MSNSQPAFAGIDVSARTLSVALSRPGQGVMQATFDNDPQAHKPLLQALTRRINQLKQEIIREQSRRHAQSYHIRSTRLIARDIQVNI